MYVHPWVYLNEYGNNISWYMFFFNRCQKMHEMYFLHQEFLAGFSLLLMEWLRLSFFSIFFLFLIRIFLINLSHWLGEEDCIFSLSHIFFFGLPLFEAAKNLSKNYPKLSWNFMKWISKHQVTLVPKVKFFLVWFYLLLIWVCIWQYCSRSANEFISI